MNSLRPNEVNGGALVKTADFRLMAFRIGMVLTTLFLFGLVFWILESGPRLKDWRQEWTINLRWTLGGFSLLILATIPIVSKCLLLCRMSSKPISRLAFRIGTLVLWDIVLSTGFVVIQLLIRNFVKSAESFNLLSIDSFMLSLGCIFVFLLIPTLLGGGATVLIGNAFSRLRRRIA